MHDIKTREGVRVRDGEVDKEDGRQTYASLMSRTIIASMSCTRDINFSTLSLCFNELSDQMHPRQNWLGKRACNDGYSGNAHPAIPRRHLMLLFYEESNYSLAVEEFLKNYYQDHEHAFVHGRCGYIR